MIAYRVTDAPGEFRRPPAHLGGGESNIMPAAPQRVCESVLQHGASVAEQTSRGTPQRAQASSVGFIFFRSVLDPSWNTSSSMRRW